MSSLLNARVLEERRKYTLGQSQDHAFLSTRSPSSSLNPMSAHVYRSIPCRHPRAPRAPYSDTTPCKLCTTLAFALIYGTFCTRLCGNASCGNASASSVADLTIAPLHEHQRAFVHNFSAPRTSVSLSSAHFLRHPARSPYRSPRGGRFQAGARSIVARARAR